MALVFMDGFDHYQAAVATAKGWNAAPSSMVAGRFGGQAFRISTNIARIVTLPSTYTTLIAGFAFRPTTSFAANEDIFRFIDAASLLAVANMNVTTAGKLIIKNNAGTTIATSTATLALGSWYYIELKIVVNGASGSCELHINGSVDIASTTGNFGSTAVAKVQLLMGATTGPVVDFDDLYVLDTTGSAPRNTFLGDSRIETLYPSADGAHSQWTPSAAGTHFDKVNEKTGTFPDGDTTYVADATVGDIDSYAADDLVATVGTVFAVQSNMYARKDDGATRQIARMIRQGGTDYVGSTLTLGSSYAYMQQIDNQDPAGADWTIANVNADEFGVKVIA